MTLVPASIGKERAELADALPAFVLGLDADWRIVLWNRQLELVTGFSRDERLGRDARDLLGDGGDRRLDLKVGGHRLVRWQLAAERDASGVTYALGVDVTDERSSLRQSLQKERLVAAGTLAAGFAHEVRNPLNSATLQLQVLRRRIERGQSGRGHLMPVIAVVQTEIARLEQLLNDFLAFAEPRRFEIESVPLNELLLELLARSENQALTSGVTIQRSMDARIGFVELEPGRIRQVFTNLLQNAFDAMPAGGTLWVRSIAAEAQGFVRVEFEDTGSGFAEDAPIFDAFYSTKPGGTGLGLAIAHKIVSEHGGVLRAEARRGGAFFSMSLPQLRK